MPRRAACIADATVSPPNTRILPVHNSVGATLNHHSFALVISVCIVHVLAIGVGGFDSRDDGVHRRRDVDKIIVVQVEERGGCA